MRDGIALMTALHNTAKHSGFSAPFSDLYAMTVSRLI